LYGFPNKPDNYCNAVKLAGVVKVLLMLPPVEFMPLLLNLSWEELIDRFGKQG
jgi:hypothetical protein